MKAQMKATEAELAARRATENRARLELRSRRDTEARARRELNSLTSERAARAERAREFQVAREPLP